MNPHATAAHTTPITNRPTGSQLAERILLGALTALIVARPLVAGDDPGRLRPTSGGGPLWLNLLTLLWVLGWGSWHGITRRRLVVGPFLILSFGLLAIGVVSFISASQADRYQRPGWFIGWDWIAMAALCFVGGQLATSAPLVRGLSAVLIATAGCLAAQALYDEAARVGRGPRTVPDALPKPAIPLVGDDPYFLKLNEPTPPRGTFRAALDQPDTLAGLLLLVLPACAIWAMAGWRQGGRGRWAVPLALMLFVAMAMSLINWLVNASIAGKGWNAAMSMIAGRPMFGVGPGNFSRNAPIGVASPGTFWMGMAATVGLLAMVILAFTLAAGLARTLPRIPHPLVEPVQATGKEYRWSYYLGGVAGLVLGMMLATSDLPAEAPGEEMLRLGAVSGGRSLVWFLIFAALEMSVPSLRWLLGSLATGVTLIALLGIVSDGLASPALMVPCVVALSLALSRVTPGANTAMASLPVAWIAAPIAFALVIANVVHVGMPGLTAAAAVRDARAASTRFSDLDLKMAGPTTHERIDAIRTADGFLIVEILNPLKEAAKTDSGNSALFSEIARWERWHIHYLLTLTEFERGRQRAAEILQLDEAIARIDPRNPVPRFSEFEAVLLLVHHSAEAVPAQISRLERLVAQIIEYDARREVELCLRVVEVLLTRRNLQTADPWAVRLLRLDAVPGEPHGNLTRQQRTFLMQQLRKIKEPSPELAELLRTRSQR